LMVLHLLWPDMGSLLANGSEEQGFYGLKSLKIKTFGPPGD
jgi:hypothetical protein